MVGDASSCACSSSTCWRRPATTDVPAGASSCGSAAVSSTKRVGARAFLAEWRSAGSGTTPLCLPLHFCFGNDCQQTRRRGSVLKLYGIMTPEMWLQTTARHLSPMLTSKVEMLSIRPAHRCALQSKGQGEPKFQETCPSNCALVSQRAKASQNAMKRARQNACQSKDQGQPKCQEACPSV